MTKLQPQNLDAEKAVLGAILLEKEAIHSVIDLLKPEMFYSDRHQEVFKAMILLNSMSHPIDSITVGNILKGKVEGFDIISLTNSVVSSAHCEIHARHIVEKYIKREQIRIANELLLSSYENTDDPFSSNEKAEKELQDLMIGLQTQTATTIDTIAVDVFKELNLLRHREQHLIGATSGYKTLDTITMGWQDSDLIIIAARPAVGKTAFTLSLALNAALNKTPAAFFSLEMSREQLTKRVLASQAQIYLSTIRGARLTDEQMKHLYTSGLRPLAGVQLFIDDTASMTVLQLKSRLRRMVRRNGIKIAFVDYLQLLKSTLGKNANRQQQIGEISRELKIMSKELHIPIIALSQLSREVEKRSNNTPQLSDLREAGDIEQDADIVMFLYGHNESEIKQDIALDSKIYLKIAKNRNGSLGNIEFEYDKGFQSFSDKGTGELTGRFIPIKEANPFI